MKSCNQCGLCCQFITIPISPEEMERSRLRIMWRESGECFPFMTLDQILGQHQDGPYYMDINMIVPMLHGRYRGTFTANNNQMYSYGPCRNLRQDNTCGIHKNKPHVCQIYDYKNTLGNPSIYKGCGYNDDLEVGWSLEELEYMQALWSNAAL